MESTTLTLRDSLIPKNYPRIQHLNSPNIKANLKLTFLPTVPSLTRSRKHPFTYLIPRIITTQNPTFRIIIITNRHIMSSSPSTIIPASANVFSSSLANNNSNKDSMEDLVALKISLLGDYHIGKTSFLTKYVGKEKGEEGFSITGLNHMDKTLCVNGARISYNIWEVEGDVSHIPVACKDSVAMLFMFDLTSRCTLNSVISWYQQARKWNQTAIPVLIGTKFDDFAQLPLNVQWTIALQARAYAKALNATLFFSSSAYNINVNKIFKFITAKIFNLPWTLERNLTIGEPIIDY